MVSLPVRTETRPTGEKAQSAFSLNWHMLWATGVFFNYFFRVFFILAWSTANTALPPTAPIMIRCCYEDIIGLHIAKGFAQTKNSSFRCLQLASFKSNYQNIAYLNPVMT